MIPVIGAQRIDNNFARHLADRETLMQAISDGHLDTVQYILANRDARGIPRVNLNSEYGNASTALMWALWANPINEQIVGVLLDARDNEGNPIVDLNRVGPHGQTIFSFILRQSCDRLRRTLLQRVLDVRGPHGELIVNLRADECNIPLLKQALRENDINCLRILLDVRLENGDRALDVNEIRYGTTVLDAALITDHFLYTYNQDMVDAIRAAGGLRSNDPLLANQQVQIRGARPERRAPIVPMIDNNPPVDGVMGNDPEHRFNRDRQNTHDPSVTQTAKGSIKALGLLYKPDDGTNEETTMREIADLVESFDYSTLIIDRSLSNAQKKECAEYCLQLIQSRSDDMHSYTGLKIKTIFFLVWQAVIDDSLGVYPDEIRRTLDPKLEKAPSYLVETKKASLIEKFIEASIAYGGAVDICVGGLIHKLLETLNHAHTRVTICTGSLSVKPAANQVPSVVAKRILEKKTIGEQRLILADWEEGKEAVEFRHLLKDPIKEELQRQFGTLIDSNTIDEIVSVLEYLTKPVMHFRLEELINIINKIPDSPDRNLAIKNYAKHAYDESERSLQEEFELLHKSFIDFLAQMSSDKVTESFASQIKYIDGADQIAACPNHLVCHLSAEQIPYISIGQVPYISKDKLQSLTDPDYIRSISQWDFVYLKKEQLSQYRNDIGAYIAVMSTLSAITCLASLVAYVVLPIIQIFSEATAEKIKEALNLNFRRLKHLFSDVIPIYFSQIKEWIYKQPALTM